MIDASLASVATKARCFDQRDGAGSLGQFNRYFNHVMTHLT